MKYAIVTLLTSLLPLLAATLRAADSIDIGSRRELFVDHHLIESLDGVRLVLHRPQPREVVLKFDQPWEGLYSGYETVLKDGDTFRFYYRGMPEAKHDLNTEVTCVAESKDGIHWTRPKLGIYEARGNKDNNIVLARSRGCHNLAPFVDSNPECPPDQRYKAMGGTGTTHFGRSANRNTFATSACFAKESAGSPARHQRTSFTGLLQSTWSLAAMCVNTSIRTSSTRTFARRISTWGSLLDSCQGDEW